MSTTSPASQSATLTARELRPGDVVTVRKTVLEVAIRKDRVRVTFDDDTSVDLPPDAAFPDVVKGPRP